VGREADALAFFDALAEAPYRFDFYQTMRRLECLHADQPRWGRALRPVDEPVRLGQDPDLSFAIAPLASFDAARGRTPRLQVRLFGLFGPNGPLPIHLTEYARERLRHADDPTLCRFLDIIHHRLIALFYRAWAQAQPTVNHDRPKDDRFMSYVGAFIGMSPATFRDRDTVPDFAKLFHVGSLIRHVRNAEGLAHPPAFFSRAGSHRAIRRSLDVVEHARAHLSELGECDPRCRRRPRPSRVGSPAQVSDSPGAIDIGSIRDVSARHACTPEIGRLGAAVSLL